MIFSIYSELCEMITDCEYCPLREIYFAAYAKKA